MTKHYITPEEHARLQRRRGRQALGLLITILVLVGFVTVLRAGVGLVANLFDDTAQKQEYEDKLEGLVLFDPMPFDGIENIDDLTLREAAVWGCIYNIQETQGGFDNYNTDPDTEQLLLPSVEVDAYLARLVGPSFKLTHRSFEMEDMTIEFDESSQCYKIPVTGTVGYYRAVVTKLFKRSGQLHVTVGYIPTSSTDDSIINQSSDTPTKYMDYLFERQSGSWYLTGLTESETKPDSTASTEVHHLCYLCVKLFLLFLVFFLCSRNYFQYTHMFFLLHLMYCGLCFHNLGNTILNYRQLVFLNQNHIFDNNLILYLIQHT